MSLHLCCARCGARLAPTFTGLRCPRLNACGRGGLVEDARMLQHPLLSLAGPHGVEA